MTGSPTAAMVIKIARAEVGYHEGRSNGQWNNHQRYSPAVPGLEWSQGQAWCATFVSWCAIQAGAAGLYPRTASCWTGVNWFRQRDRFSYYPAVGAQVFYGEGGGTHTGIVYRYDGTYVYTIEGNTNADGSAEGDGVYLKKRRRHDDYVYGYGYPAFAEGIESADPRWEDSAPSGGSPADDDGDQGDGDHPPRYRVTINGLEYGYGATGDHVTAVGRALVARGHGDAYQVGPGPTWSDADTANYRAYQLALGYHGADADGVPGPTSLTRLLGSLPGGRPTVDLSELRAAARTDPPASGTPVSYSGARVVEDALTAEGLLDAQYADGHFGTATVHAYARWQHRCGYSGTDADGIPGRASLDALAERHGFTVTA